MSGHTGRRILGTYCVVLGIVIVFPLVVIVPVAFNSEKNYHFPPDGLSTRWFRELFESEAWRSAAMNSFRIAILSTLLSLVVGTLAALGLVRGRFPGKAIVSGLVIAPAIVPIVMMSVATYLVFLRWKLVGTTVGYVLAHSVVTVPIVVITVAASLRTFDERLELAAASLGAGRWTTFWKITFPLIRPSVAAAALFAFVGSFDETVISLLLASPKMQTLPVRLFGAVFRENDPKVAVVSTLMMGLTLTLILLGAVVQRTRIRDRS